MVFGAHERVRRDAYGRQRKRLARSGHRRKEYSLLLYAVQSAQKEKRLVLLSEYGGYSYQEKGHVFNNKKFGYRIYNDKESLNAAYKKLHEKLIIPAIKDGLAATVYTQVSDVESEINGLLTYDRRVLKVDPDMVRAVNAQLKL